jgi:hypothetical protein
MTIEVGWENEEKTILIERFDGAWTWEEFYAAIQQAASMMAEVEHRVDVLADMIKADRPPSGTAMTHARNMMRLYPDNWGIMVIVANNLLITTSVNMFRRLFRANLGKKIHTAKTVEEAYVLIAEQIKNATSS